MRTQVMLIASMAAGGCGFSSTAKPTDAHDIDTPVTHDGSADAMIDGTPDAPQQDFGTGVWTVHVPTLPTSGLAIMGNIDTGPASTDCMTTAMWTDGSQPDACFIVATTIDTGNNVTVRGPRPLVLVATDSIMIDKHVDVASHRSQMPGPAADWSGCGSPTAGADRSSGGGGGAGGTFITVGGSGGAGDNGQSNPGIAINTVLPAPSILHGGCPGSDGGAGSGGAGHGASGGGAIYLVAGRQITITDAGLVNASGAGPSGGGHASGGGGAGSGGTIVLYAPAIMAMNGTVMANGGGGGGGGDNNSNGTNGNDAMIAMPTAQAPGGNGPNGLQGTGGAGFSTANGAGDGRDGATGEGGGGGGGGAGYIRSNVMLSGATASPAVDVVP